MPLDLKYVVNDIELDASEGNYATTPGAFPKVARLLVSAYCEIDGVSFGNRAWTDLARAQDDPQNRQILKRYCEAAIKPLVDSGEIRDVSVTVDDPANADGVAVRVAFFDVAAARVENLSTVPPWAKV